MRRRYISTQLARSTFELRHVDIPNNCSLTGSWHGRYLTLSGVTTAGTVSLVHGNASHSVNVHKEESSFHFHIFWPLEELSEALLTLPNGKDFSIRPSGIRAEKIWLNLKLLMVAFIMAPSIFSWFVRKDENSKAKIKRTLGLEEGKVFGPIDPLQLTPSLESGSKIFNFVILLPVYNNFKLVRQCMDRVATNTTGNWTLVVVDDCSSDPLILPFLRDFAELYPRQVHVLEQTANEGFVATVNAGLAFVLANERFADQPVVLLNSDALVPYGWDNRLLAPLTDNDVASVTPMSNDAEIFSVPVICAPTTLPADLADDLDRAASTLPATASVSAPTGVGFCMALSRRFLDQVPAFDTIFGRGYGEEVDWCQRTRALGGRHIGTAQLFVEHQGGQSFGSAEKQKLIQQNNLHIIQRYPRYSDEVQEFIFSDPLRAPRLLLAIAWAAGVAGEGKVPVYLAHSLGGGADHWLSARLSADASSGRPSVVLRVGGAARWQLEVTGPMGTIGGYTDDLDVVFRLLAPLDRRHVIYSCGVGDADPVSLPNILLTLASGANSSLELLFHDYFPISPSFTLLGSDGAYHGPITPETIAASPQSVMEAHIARRTGGQKVSLSDWQSAWGELADRSEVIRVFSSASAKIVAAVWPHLADRIVLSPHRRAENIRAFRPKAGPSTLGILGNIAPHKGASLVRALAEIREEQRGFSIALIGNIDPSYALPRKCRVHGDYKPADIPDLARHYGITHWLIPSIWPETFSFTTHEALATGLPVMAFDIGAQGDAVRAAPNGIPLPYDPDANLTQTVLDAFRKVPHPYTEM